MKKTTKILVPFDFSACAENALRFAIRLSDKIDANLLVLNVAAFDANGMENPTIVLSAVNELKGQLKTRIKKAITKATKSVRPSIDTNPLIQTNVEIGKIEATICDQAIINQSDYIVIGTQGENSTLDKYLGSVASNILNNAPCPVIVVPKNAELKTEMAMAYATDFSDATPFEIWKAVKFFKPFQPQIKCVHFNEKQVDNQDKIKELESYFSESAPDLNITFYSLPVKDKVKDMNDFIRNNKINMLVMYKPKRNFFDLLFHKSYTKKMAMHTNIPLMVLKE